MNEPRELATQQEKQALNRILKIEDAYTQDTKQMASFLDKNKLSFNTAGVVAWTKELQRRLDTHEISARSYNKKLSAVKHRLRLIFNRNTESLDPVAVIRFKALLADMKPVKIAKNEIRVNPDKVLSPEKIEELRKAADPRLALMIEFLRDTGSRVTEMLTAGLGKVRKDGVEIQLIGKGQKMRSVRIEKDLYNRILREFGGTTYLFEHQGKQYNRISVTDRLRKLSGELWGRESKISAHVLRHSFITEALRQNVPIEQVADYVGHASPDTTHRQYNHNVADWSTTFKGLMKSSRNTHEDKK